MELGFVFTYFDSLRSFSVVYLKMKRFRYRIFQLFQNYTFRGSFVRTTDEFERGRENCRCFFEFGSKLFNFDRISWNFEDVSWNAAPKLKPSLGIFRWANSSSGCETQGRKRSGGSSSRFVNSRWCVYRNPPQPYIRLRITVILRLGVDSESNKNV